MTGKPKPHPEEPAIARPSKPRVDTEPLPEETLEKIAEALQDLEAGRVFATEEVKKLLEAPRG